ncbi:MAG: energy-coupling factor ABC transporter ATP-binding protein [Elainellaceae cyanobacterium]
MIELQRVSHSFESSRPVLQDISLQLREPRIGIIGSNGSGKSTLARLLNGLILPEQGKVWVDGLNTRKQVRQVRRKVGFVFQNPDSQIILPTVEEDIEFGLKILKLSPAIRRQRVSDALTRYGLEALRHQPAHTLSGGQKQLLAIAAVMVMQPQYLVFDEPTTLLDLRNRNRLQRLLRSLAQPIIVVSHDLDLLQDFDRVIVLERGRVVKDGEPAAAIAYYQELMAEDSSC